MRSVCVVIVAAFCSVILACSTSAEDTPKCQKCDGNTAVTCDGATCNVPDDYDYSTLKRTDCGSKKCTESVETRDCTYEGSEFTQSFSVVDCE